MQATQRNTVEYALLLCSKMQYYAVSVNENAEVLALHLQLPKINF